MRVGVLALQGDFLEHVRMLSRMGADAVEVRLPQHLENVDALIIPGGESTTIGKIADRWGLMDPIRALARSGRPLWGTCAGMILLAKEVIDGARDQPLLRLLDVSIRRNGFGRQVDSFETDLAIPVIGEPPFHCVFIRAPFVESWAKEDVRILARLTDGTVVAVQEGNILATAFHPELTEDGRIHRFFLSLGSSPGR
jgi:5'-phosphate synthase pdxT subunit